MRRLACGVVVAWISLVSWACAQDAEDLARALRLGDVVEIMAREGLVQGDELDAGLLGGNGGAAWDRVVAGIYDAPGLTRDVQAGFAAALDPEAARPLLEFFTSPEGQRIVDLEVEARRALLDPEAQAAAEASARAASGARRARIEAFIEANDLLERNVAGAMNASLAFYGGLAQGDAFGGSLDEAGILADVWAQEPTIRRDTRDWLWAFLGLAHGPLGAEQYDAYLALGRSPEGRAMNAALFAAFDAMFEDVSRDLGRAAAAFLQGSEL